MTNYKSMILIKIILNLDVLSFLALNKQLPADTGQLQTISHIFMSYFIHKSFDLLYLTFNILIIMN